MNDLIELMLKLQEFEFADFGDSHAEPMISKLRQKIPPPILAHYDRLADQGKKGVAIVRHQVCTGCHMRLPIATVVTLMHDSDIRTCDHCGRYLYLEPDAKFEPLVKVPEAKAAGEKRRPKRTALHRTN